MTIYSKTARVAGWGSDKNARRVTHLTPEERELIRAGGEVRIADCPEYHGITERRIVEIGRRFYARMP
jgi:hypothetical protein